MYEFFTNAYVWGTMAVISLLVCLDIEYQWFLIPSESLEMAQATNRIHYCPRKSVNILRKSL